MKIHEYQGKAILKKYGVTVPRGTMATSREEAEAAARRYASLTPSWAELTATGPLPVDELADADDFGDAQAA